MKWVDGTVFVEPDPNYITWNGDNTDSYDHVIIKEIGYPSGETWEYKRDTSNYQYLCTFQFLQGKH